MSQERERGASKRVKRARGRPNEVKEKGRRDGQTDERKDNVF